MRDIILSVPLDEASLRTSAAAAAAATSGALPHSRLALKTLAELEDERAQEEIDEDSDDPEAARQRRAQALEEESKRRGTAYAREVEQVLSACVAHGLEDEARAVCKVSEPCAMIEAPSAFALVWSALTK